MNMPESCQPKPPGTNKDLFALFSRSPLGLRQRTASRWCLIPLKPDDPNYIPERLIKF
jgi:hypothetical protein